jgi:hypothetical protein
VRGMWHRCGLWVASADERTIVANLNWVHCHTPSQMAKTLKDHNLSWLKCATEFCRSCKSSARNQPQTLCEEMARA